MKTPKDHASECFLCALSAFSADLLAWLDAGGDKRLLEFAPLNGWHTVSKHLSAMQRRGETQHSH